MEDNFRNTLIIISAVIIGAIFAHGLWTIRKNKNPYKLKANKEKTDPIKRSFDHGGFDQDGVGKIKVKPQDGLSANELSDTQVLTSAAQDKHEEPTNKVYSESDQNKVEIEADTTSDDKKEPIVGSLEIPSFDALEKTMKEISVNESTDMLSATNDNLITEIDTNINNDLAEAEDESSSDKAKVILEEVISAKPLYSQPVSRPKPKSKAELKRDQIEINFGGDSGSSAMPSMSAIKQGAAEQGNEQSNVQPEVLALSVVMPQNQIMHGASLLPLLLTLGLKYGEMNIFHRHQDNAGTGPVTFSLANMMNPGSFDLDNMETFATQGVTLFMMLPNAGNAFDVYQQLLFAAKQLSEEFNAQILDDKRNVMTKQTEQHYLSRIRDFEIKNRAATS